MRHTTETNCDCDDQWAKRPHSLTIPSSLSWITLLPFLHLDIFLLLLPTMMTMVMMATMAMMTGMTPCRLDGRSSLHGVPQGSILNSVTAIDAHKRPLFNKLCGTVVYCRIFIRSQSLIARWTCNDLSLPSAARNLCKACCIDDVSRGSKSYLFCVC